MNKIISIQLEYIFNDRWAAAVQRTSTTRIYTNLTESTWFRIANLPAKTQSGTLDGTQRQLNFQ